MDGRVEQIRKMQENLYWRVVCCLPHAEVHANIAYLLERLDEDGGGDIDFEEFRRFWDEYVFD